MTVFTRFAIITGLKKPMNPVFPKLPRSYAADAVWSRFFFHKKMKTSVIGGSVHPWNNGTSVNAWL
jgi:hypothetical protein